MTTRRGVVAAAASAAAATMPGCVYLFPREAPIPMASISHRGPCTAPGPAWLVMLPGAYSEPGDFTREGFVAALRERGVAADISAADTHLGYFARGLSIERLHEDVIAPQQQGRALWLVGISLGAFIAMAYAARHPARVRGLVLLSPYPGRRQQLAAMHEQGGVMAWHQATRGQVVAKEGPDTDADHEVWHWLAGLRSGASSGAPSAGAPTSALGAGPQVFLGYGRADRFEQSHRWMSECLPPGQALAIDGDHDWPTWRALWTAWLDRGVLPRRCD